MFLCFFCDENVFTVMGDCILFLKNYIFRWKYNLLWNFVKKTPTILAVWFWKYWWWSCETKLHSVEIRRFRVGQVRKHRGQTHLHKVGSIQCFSHPKRVSQQAGFQESNHTTRNDRVHGFRRLAFLKAKNMFCKNFFEKFHENHVIFKLVVGMPASGIGVCCSFRAQTWKINDVNW